MWIKWVVLEIATMIMTKHQVIGVLVFFILGNVSALEQDLLSCDTPSQDSSGYSSCNGNGFPNQCDTFAVLRANSYYSSLLNLSSYLGINRFVLARANDFSDDTEFLPQNHPLSIPIECKCSGDAFEAVISKTTIKGESFDGITESLEGLTTCKSIREKNPSVSPWDLRDKIQLLIPLRCACPSSSELGQKIKFLISYPVSGGDTISNLASKFNVTQESIISANSRGSGGSLKPDNLLPVSTTLLIPVKEKPVFGSNWGFPNPHKRKTKMWEIGVYVAVSVVVFVAGISLTAAFLVIQWKKKKNQKQIPSKMSDLEIRKRSLSIRTTSEKKVSFDQGSHQDTLDGQIIIDMTPRQILVEKYLTEEMRKATEDFNLSNLIEGSVFHGRLSGKNLAIKRAKTELLSKIEFGLFHDATHHHPNIIRLVGTCSTDGPDSYLVFEYAKNGSLKDWLHGGLAMKSQFIASCYCFLNWNQRLRICLGVATALQYMHQIIVPSYVHRNIKSQNIFLDEEFNAKVGNFGIPTYVEDDTEEQFWTKGYLAPEYVQHGIVSSETDIFAYGVVLLEVLSGEKPITRGNEKGEMNVWLSEKIKSVVRSENAEELRGWMDNALAENYGFDAAVTLANLARACVEDDPCLRPSAGEIAEKLSKLVEELPGEEFSSLCECSSKPLVEAAGNSLSM